MLPKQKAGLRNFSETFLVKKPAFGIFPKPPRQKAARGIFPKTAQTKSLPMEFFRAPPKQKQVRGIFPQAQNKFKNKKTAILEHANLGARSTTVFL